MSELKLFADAKWESPWVFHAMVALEELRLRYALEPVRFPIGDDLRAELRAHAKVGLVPCVADGDFWMTESSAISEYLAEKYAPPAFPRILPADLHERARARQAMSWLRTTMMGLREDRPTSSVFMRPVTTPLSEKGKRDATELIRVAEAWVAPGRNSIGSEWSIADADLALMLMRLVANNDAGVPQRLIDYCMATWSRQSVRKYLAYIPTTH